MKVYAHAPAAFGQTEQRLLGLLAETATTLLEATPPVSAPARQHTAAQQERDTVAAATAVLMTRDHLDPAAAPTALLELARTQGRRLIDVAAHVLETAVGHQQARLLGATMVVADISRADLWLYHRSIGGDTNELEIDAYLHHCLTLPRLQRDLLAVAANEILADTTPPQAPYAAETLTDLTPTPQ